MNYKFELRKDKKNKNGLMPIRLVVTHNGKRIRIAIPAKVKEEDWDCENELIKNPNNDSEYYRKYSRSNKAIVETKEKVEQVFSFFKYNQIPFSKEKFLSKYSGKENQLNLTFFEAYEEYIKVSKPIRAKSSITKYKAVRKFLMDFEEHTGFKLRLDNIDFRFEESFRDYCFYERKTLNNYYAKIIKTLQAFMNWCYKRGYHSSLKFKELDNKEDEIEVIHLTMDELIRLYNYPFENESLDRARDFFCFLCFTGQRHSDIYTLKGADLKKEHLNITITKTKDVGHTIHLTKQARELVEKYRDTIYFPIPRITSQKLNKRIQKCCEIIGLTEEITLTRYVGGRRLDETFRKCDLITSHVGRKTFVTNSLVLGISERMVREITNHKDEKSFRRYVRISNLQKQKELEKWDF